MDNVQSQLDPKQILTPERFMEYEKSVIGSERVAYAVKLIDRDGVNVLDACGARGEKNVAPELR